MPRLTHRRGDPHIWPGRIGAAPIGVRLVSRGVSWLPWPLAGEVMAALGVAHALARPDRLRRAWRWAASQPGPRRPWSLVCSLFAHHGRFIAWGALAGIPDPDALRRRVRVEGLDRWNRIASAGGAILLGFHLGPPGVALGLRALGHDVVSLARPESSLRPSGPQWEPLLRSAHRVSISGAEPAERVRGLHEATRLVAEGRTIYVTADGPLGRAAFEIPLPGRPAVLRAGWLALRRHTGAPTLPTLSRHDGSDQIITIHEPLPPVDPDPDRDAAACRDALSPLLADYLRRLPEQCRFLAFWADEGAGR